MKPKNYNVAKVSDYLRLLFWCENLKEGAHLEDIGIEGNIILKCVLKK
jgi:hypothetical protein